MQDTGGLPQAAAGHRPHAPVTLGKIVRIIVTDAPAVLGLALLAGFATGPGG